MGLFHGIAIYEISEKGNLLKAIYTNTALRKGTIVREHARKRNPDDKGIVGIYDAKYFKSEIDPIKMECTLEIERFNKDEEPVFYFKWIDKNNGVQFYEGIGLKSGHNHISVSYIRLLDV
jgi:hypothetical protein